MTTDYKKQWEGRVKYLSNFVVCLKSTHSTRYPKTYIDTFDTGVVSKVSILSVSITDLKNIFFRSVVSIRPPLHFSANESFAHVFIVIHTKSKIFQ